jgi:hypothetical protein
LAGALTPLKGSAPTNGGGLFQDADLDPGIGLKGDGATKYLSSNRTSDSDGQDDCHLAVFETITHSNGSNYGVSIGAAALPTSQRAIIYRASPPELYGRANDYNSTVFARPAATVGFTAVSRSDNASLTLRYGGANNTIARSSVAMPSRNIAVFCQDAGSGPQDFSNPRISWYSIGSSTDLAALDSAVSTLMADLRAIDEQGFEPETVNYLRAVEAADGSFLETGVKQAINRFIVGLKKDNLWSALKASAILCGARTIAGALVPLAGTAPTAYNFVSANYNRETGLIGVPASSTYIDTNRANDADGQDDVHVAAYLTASANNASYVIGANAGGSNNTLAGYDFWCRSLTGQGPANAAGAGLNAVSRSSSASFTYVDAGGAPQTSAKASATQSTVNNVFVFAANVAGSPANITNARIAFYSIGSAISDLSLLDTRVTNLVTEIAAAIP